MLLIDKIELTQNVIRFLDELQKTEESEIDLEHAVSQTTGLFPENIFHARELYAYLQSNYRDHNKFDVKKVYTKDVLDYIKTTSFSDDTYDEIAKDIEYDIEEYFLSNEKYRKDVIHEKTT